MMAVAVEGSLDSPYIAAGAWPGLGAHLSHERRLQLATEAAAAFRARCSVLMMAALEAVRRECERCLAQAVDDAVQRYSAMLQDALLLHPARPPAAAVKEEPPEEEEAMDACLDDAPPPQEEEELPPAASPPAVHPCELCGRQFSRRGHLRRHRLIHTGERPFTCPACQRSFSQKVHLKVHMRTHGAGPPLLCHASPPAEKREHRCGECGKAFTRASHLQRHQLTHTGERPHACPVCCKAFSQKVHLQVHLRRQHPVADEAGTSESIT